MRRQRVLLVAVVALCTLSGACRGAKDETRPWQLATSSKTSRAIKVSWGDGVCDEIRRIAVDESPHRVSVTVHLNVQHKGVYDGHDCTAADALQVGRPNSGVAYLAKPLGDRQIVDGACPKAGNRAANTCRNHTVKVEDR